MQQLLRTDTKYIKINIYYYPGGMLQPGRSFNAGDYRFGYNGKEMDSEIKGLGNSYDFDARIFDPRLLKWMSVDPEEKKYPMISTYAGMGNNPIYFVDPGGETLRVAGQILQASIDMVNVLPEGYLDKVSMGPDNTILFDLTKEEAEQSGDPGVVALFTLVNSEKVYEWNVSKNVDVMNQNGEVRNVEIISAQEFADGFNENIGDKLMDFLDAHAPDIIGTSQVPFKYGGRGNPIGDKPVDPNVDVQRVMRPDFTGYGPNGSSREGIVLHEILEMTNQGENGMPYSPGTSKDPKTYKGKGAHNTAIEQQAPVNDKRKDKDQIEVE